MTLPDSEVPDILLEQYLLGELSQGQRELLCAKLELEPELQKRLTCLSHSNQEILAHYPSKWIMHSIKNRQTQLAQPVKSPKRRFTLPRLQVALPALAILMAGLFITMNPNEQTPVFQETSSIRLKGAEAGLIIYRKVTSGSELIPPHSLAQPGDTLQVFYHNKNQLYGMIFSVDGTGASTLHYPEYAGPAQALKIGSQIALPHAYLLDQAPSLERFFLVTSPEPFFCDTVLAQFQKTLWPGQAIPDSIVGLKGEYRQYSYTVRKPSQPEAKQDSAVKK